MVAKDRENRPIFRDLFLTYYENSWVNQKSFTALLSEFLYTMMNQII